ncbi:MAG: serine/threonine protein kinase [Atopobiaceae bacterium]|nr:serine/threonine protein kinase [Atopobiaceae bacterium]
MGTPCNRIGTIIDGKFEVLARLGEGGMSTVWLARDVRLHKLWAIKEIKPNEHGVRGSILRQALIDEADFLKRLDHPAIPRVVDIIDTGRTVFVVMDYVEGNSLGELLEKRERPYGQDQVIAWGLQLCDVLAYLHGRTPPVIYRDMKPANVILREDGSVRLIDFGIAAEREAKGSHGRVPTGTPGYAAPEQLGDASGAMATPQATMDVYALGATLYSLVTGHVPRLIREGGEQRARARVDFAMRPIRMWDARLSEGLEQVILRATEEDPRMRYQSMEEMRYDLEHHVRLSKAWRQAQRQKVLVFRRWCIAAGMCLALGCSMLLMGFSMREANYEELMRAASVASRDAAEDTRSDAEKLYDRAIAVAPDRVEPFHALLGVYETDYNLTDEEDRRWRQELAKAGPIERDASYAQFCYEVGLCYLSYYRIDQGGGAVGNAAIASMDAARDWFERALKAHDERMGDDGALEPGDEQAARTYVVVCGFHECVSRAGREGRAATDEYRTYWESLEKSVDRVSDASQQSWAVEGVKSRLCQVASESMASPTYLLGFARAGIGEARVHMLLAHVRECCSSLDDFANAKENSEVYAPLFKEIRTCLDVAGRTIEDVYHNPVSTYADQGEEVRT